MLSLIISIRLKTLYDFFIAAQREEWDKDWYKASAHGICDLSEVYDRLKEEGKTNLSISPEEKKRLWDLAVKRFNIDNKDRIRRTKSHSDTKIRETLEKTLKTDLNKVMKSFIVRDMLADKYYKDNITVTVNDDNGNEIKPFKWKGER